MDRDNPLSLLQIYRTTLALSWIYHGVFPKLISVARMEKAITATQLGGVPDFNASSRDNSKPAHKPHKNKANKEGKSKDKPKAKYKGKPKNKSFYEEGTFKRKAREDRQVTHFYCIAGEADFILVVMAKDIAGYEAFTHRFFFSDRNVRKFRTSIVVSTEKATSELPIS